jgi:predicted Rdx family selenoprotein
VPSKGGVFEVVVDGDLVSSKKSSGRHASYEEILASVRSRSDR